MDVNEKVDVVKFALELEADRIDSTVIGFMECLKRKEQLEAMLEKIKSGAMEH